jgi:hypothetical protein
MEKGLILSSQVLKEGSKLQNFAPTSQENLMLKIMQKDLKTLKLKS